MDLIAGGHCFFFSFQIESPTKEPKIVKRFISKSFVIFTQSLFLLIRGYVCWHMFLYVHTWKAEFASGCVLID